MFGWETSAEHCGAASCTDRWNEPSPLVGDGCGAMPLPAAVGPSRQD